MSQTQRPEDDPRVVDVQAEVVHSSAAPDDGAHQPATTRLGDALRRWWQGGTRSSDDLMQAVRDESALAREHTAARVRQEPVKAVAVAAAAGAVLGMLLAAGSRRNKGR